VQRGIADDPAVGVLFFRYYPVSHEAASPSPKDWKSYACGITSFTPAAFASCACAASP
jgi:hypothetical protein